MLCQHGSAVHHQQSRPGAVVEPLSQHVTWVDLEFDQLERTGALDGQLNRSRVGGAAR